MNTVLQILLFSSGWILAASMLSTTMAKLETTIGDMGSNGV